MPFGALNTVVWVETLLEVHVSGIFPENGVGAITNGFVFIGAAVFGGGDVELMSMPVASGAGGNAFSRVFIASNSRDDVFSARGGSSAEYSRTALMRSIENGCVRAIRSHELRDDGDICSKIWNISARPLGS